MEHTNTFIEQLVQRYISGKATNEELEVFLHLLKEGKLDEILSQSMDHSIANLSGKPKVRRIILIGSWHSLKIAATVTLFVVCGLLTIRHYDSLIHRVSAVGYEQVRSGRSEIKEVMLMDGSKLRLNAGSIFEYPEEFNDTVRAVRLLDGEAFFTVVHDPVKPFVVWAGGVRTEVLGTEFNIRSYDTFETVQVTVASGKVTVSNLSLEKEKQNDAILEEHDQLTIYKKSGDQKRSKVNPMETLGWREGKLFFNNERFADVAFILANKFDIEIVFADPTIKDYRFSAAFEANDSLTVVFDALTMANNLSYSIRNKIITLTKNDNPK